jgi:drug/metabolite transporter (DMT)-like permease
MDTNLIIAVVLGALGSLTLNIGKGIQKWKVDVLKHKLKALQPQHRKEFLIWLTGVMVTVTAGPLYSVSFKFADQPSLITSLGGIGLIGVLIFSKIVLNEHLNRIKIFGAFLIVVGTVMVNYFVTKSSDVVTFENSVFIKLVIAYTVFFSFLTVLSLLFRPIAGRAMALGAGTCLGTSMILADVALVSSGGDLFTQFLGVYIYIAIIAGNCAFVLTQFALMKEDGSVVIPIIHSMVIIISIVMEYMLYSSILKSIQLVGVAVIIIGVFLLTKKAQQEQTQGHTILEQAQA